MSKSNRRIGVIINYACVLLSLVFFYFGKYNGWTDMMTVVTILVLVSALVSFVVLHIKTHLWRLVHTRADKLDERQIQVTHESLRYAYGIFSVISLLVLLVIALLAGENDSMLILIFASLLYLAHTLPSSIIAWTEKEV